MKEKWYLILALGALILTGCNGAAALATTVPAMGLPTLPPELPTATDLPADTPTPTGEPSVRPTPLGTATSNPFVQPSLTGEPEARPSATLSVAQPTVTLRGTPMNLNPTIDSLVQKARADLAVRLGVAPGSIVTKSAETVDWPDGSLGCPQPGRMYVQMITPGVLIVLEANGKTYEYHGTMRNVSLCEKKP